MSGPLRRTFGRAWRKATHPRVPSQARRLAHLLENPAAAADAGPDVAQLAGVAARLPFVAVRPSEEFRTAVRERLLVEPAPVRPHSPVQTQAPVRSHEPVNAPAAVDQGNTAEEAGERRATARTGARAAVVAGIVGLALVGGATAAVAASADALPGQPLYAAKRSIEQVQLALTFEKVARGERLLKLADVRVDEAEELLERDTPTTWSSGDIEAVNEALSGAHRRVAEADDVLLTAYRLSGDPQPAQSLDAAARELRVRLLALPPGAPELRASSAALVAALEQVLVRTSSVSSEAR